MEAWKGNAEFISKNFRKEAVDLSGRLKTSRWKDDKGDTHYQTSVLVENVEFAPTNNRKPSEKPDKYEQGESIGDLSDFEEIPDSETPF